MPAAGLAFPAAILADRAVLEALGARADPEDRVESAARQSLAFRVPAAWALQEARPDSVDLRWAAVPREDLAAALDAVAVVVRGLEAEGAEVAVAGGPARLAPDAAACSRCLAWHAWHCGVPIGFALT
jgi:hypothetical protein